MWYNVDIARLAVQLLPPVLRGSLTVALVRILTLPLRWVASQIAAWREGADTTLGTTAQVASLEAALNRLFHLEYGQIYIDTPEWTDRGTAFYLQCEDQATRYVYALSEKKPSYCILQEEDVPEVNFTVMVPTFLCTSTESRTADKYGWRHLSQIKQTINRYKPAGRTYRIMLYEYE